MCRHPTPEGNKQNKMSQWKAKSKQWQSRWWLVYYQPTTSFLISNMYNTCLGYQCQLPRKTSMWSATHQAWLHSPYPKTRPGLFLLTLAGWLRYPSRHIQQVSPVSSFRSSICLRTDPVTVTWPFSLVCGKRDTSDMTTVCKRDATHMTQLNWTGVQPQSYLYILAFTVVLLNWCLFEPHLPQSCWLQYIILDLQWVTPSCSI